MEANKNVQPNIVRIHISMTIGRDAGAAKVEVEMAV
jgi:hypothetical protein